MTRGRALVDKVSGFFFLPQPTTTVAIVRIAFGLLSLAFAYSISGDLDTFFGVDGLSPGRSGPSLFALGRGSEVIAVALGALVVCAACMTLGLFTRVATIGTYVLVLSFQHEMPWVFSSGDVLLRIGIGLVCLMPAGAALSVDRWRTDRDTFWSAPLRPPWALRLMQLQLSLIYLSSVYEKLKRFTWRDGRAMYYGFRMEDISRVELPVALLHSDLVMRSVTWGLIAAELSLAVLVWTRLRRSALAAGFVVHLLGHIFLLLGLFSYIVWAYYLAFVRPDEFDHVLSTGRRVLRNRGRVGSVAPGGVTNSEA